MSALAKYLAKLASNPETSQYGKMGNEVMRNAILNKFYDAAPNELTTKMLRASNKSVKEGMDGLNSKFSSGEANKDVWDQVAKEMVKLRRERGRL